MERAGEVFTYLIEIFKNHKLIKIFQKETFETSRADKALEGHKDRQKKLNEIYARSSPIMEVLTGFMIAILIYYSGNLIIQDEIGINNFFSFLAAMMLAYQPVRSLATVNMLVYQGAAAADRVFKIIDREVQIKNKSSILNRSRPQSVASGLVRYYILKNNKNISLSEFKSKVNLSELTINRICKEITKILES